MNELITSALLSGDTTDIISLQNSKLLNSLEKKWIDWIDDYVMKFGVPPTLERFEKNFETTFVRVESSDPIADVFEQTLQALRNRFVREYVTKHQESLKNGDDPSTLVQDLFEAVRHDKRGLVDIADFDKSDYFHVGELLPTGLETLDTVTGGFAKGDLAFIAGRLGDGKTTLLRYLIAKWYLDGKKILLISNEIRWDEMLWQIDAILGCLPPGEKRSGKFSEETKRRLKFLRYFAKNHTGKIVIPKHTVRNPADLYGMIAEYHPDVIAIDGAYLMSGDGKATAEWQQLAIVTRELKQMANNQNVAIIGVIQANRQAEAQKHISSSSLAGSDTFGQDADIVLSVKFDRIEGMRRFSSVYTTKNRFGELKSFDVWTDYECMMMGELPYETV